jgi:hypothetical protein
METSNRGGLRSNSGRKPLLFKKVVLSFRVDERHAKELKIKIKQIINDTNPPIQNPRTY